MRPHQTVSECQRPLSALCGHSQCGKIQDLYDTGYQIGWSNCISSAVRKTRLAPRGLSSGEAEQAIPRSRGKARDAVRNHDVGPK